MKRIAADQVLSELAASRYGLVSHEAALKAGITSRQLEYRVRSGALVKVLPRVSRMTSVVPSWEQNQLAACIWAGRGWLSSGLAAAALYELEGLGRRRVEISGAGRISRIPPGLVVHERCVFIPGDATSRRGIPATSPARTIIDLCSLVDQHRVERAFESALRRGFVTPEYLMRRMRRLGTKGRKGIASLIEILVRRGDAPPSDSDFEILLTQVLRAARLPQPARQQEIFDDKGFIARVDFVYPLIKVILEADSYKHHGGRLDWENDNAKRRRLAAVGYRILPITWRMVNSNPGEVQALVRQALQVRTP